MDAKSRLIAEAVVTYADACTLPGLTPSCPFYRLDDGAPACSEECRMLAAQLGAEGRDEREARIGGLVMRGRAIPLRVVGGMRDYDATRSYIIDKDKPPREQSTPSLLLSLTSAVIANAFIGDVGRLDDALRLWGEAERRIGALDAVFRGGMAEQIATAVAVRVALEHLHHSGVSGASKGIDGTVFGGGSSWLEAARLSAEHVISRPTRRQAVETPDKTILSAALPQLFDTDEVLDELVSDAAVAHALTGTFRRRVVRWLSNLLPVDLAGTLSARPPHAPLFAALEPTLAREPVGVWLWERFTTTHVEDWSTGSLAFEWEWASSTPDVPCDPRAMAERIVEADTTSRLAMARSLRAFSQPVRAAGFEPSEYVRRATNLLVKGRWDEAIQIFEGLVELSPGDAEAWNNLGFCQLVADPAASISMLQRAATLSRTPSLLTAANLALALHLTGRDEEALKVGHNALTWESPSHASGTWLWEHPSLDVGLDAELVLGEVTDIHDYLSRLLEHIREVPSNICSRPMADESAGSIAAEG